MLLIGSRALDYWELLDRTPKDWDLICSEENMIAICKNLKFEGSDLRNTSDSKYTLKKDNLQIEFELINYSESARLYENLDVSGLYNHSIPGWPYAAKIAHPRTLFSIKKSHIHYPRFWDKHIRDYHLLKKYVGFDRYPDVTKIRKSETEIRLGRLKTPSLNKNKDDFFDDNVSNRTFVHDDIHKVMAHYGAPMYERIKIDPNKVACSKEKFYALPNTERVMCVLEEAYVIALERCIIPMLYEGKRFIDSEKAFEWAVMRICTTLCSGWFRTFAVEEWPAIIQSHNKDYVKKFFQAVENKDIERIK